LPPVALTAGQRAQVAEAYATQGQVYVPGRGMLSPWAAEQVWLQAARARREAEATAAMATLNTRVLQAAEEAASVARYDDGVQGLDESGGGSGGGGRGGGGRGGSTVPPSPGGSTPAPGTS